MRRVRNDYDTRVYDASATIADYNTHYTRLRRFRDGRGTCDFAPGFAFAEIAGFGEFIITIVVPVAEKRV